jgi:geranylgeranyl diphosphate synthase type II
MPMFNIPGWEDIHGPEFIQRCTRDNDWGYPAPKSGVRFHDILSVSSCYLRNLRHSGNLHIAETLEQIETLGDGRVDLIDHYPFLLLDGEDPVALCNASMAQFAARKFDHGTIGAAIRYLQATSGKRVRALALLALAIAHRIPPKTCVPLAAAVEFLHAASLIQDDLPCMDDDSFRRGVRALHTVFGEEVALLTSDALLVLAVDSTLLMRNAIGAEKTLALVSTLTATIGPGGLISGQMQDLEMRERERVSTDEFVAAYRLKTAPLFEFAGRTVAIVAGLPSAETDRLSRAMSDIGVAFQIVDDLLDADPGKQRMLESDVKNAMPTLGSLAGADAERLVTQFIESARNQYPLGSGAINRLIEFIVNRRT